MNISDLYSTRIQKTYDEDQTEIVSILKANIKKTFKLINYYKGLPLSYPATIAAVDRGILDLDVTAEQAFAIEKYHSAFIRSPLFKHDIFAQAQYVNIKKGVATFAKFSYVEIMAERRNFIRMAPESHSSMTLESPHGIVNGHLYDISLSGLNVTVHESCPLEMDSESKAHFKLYNFDQSQVLQIHVPAKLIAISGEALPRNYRFSIAPDKSLERQLSQYIIHRQIEIIREIKDTVS